MKIFLNEQKTSYIDSNAVIKVDLIKLSKEIIKKLIYKNIEEEFNTFMESLKKENL